MAHPKVKISDNNGNVVSVTNNKLDVNAVLSASDNIEIGNVDIKLNGTGVSADEGNADAGTIRMTIADDDNHFGAIGTASDVDGNIHGQLRYIGTQTEAALIQTGEAYSEGHYHTTGIVRNDTLASLVSADNDYSVLQINSIGGLYVTGSEVEDAAVQGQPMLMGGRYDASTRSLNDGDAGAIAVTAKGYQEIVIKDLGGTTAIVASADSDSSPDLDGFALLGTHALLSARSDASTTCGVTCVNSTHNALHVAISDGAEVANVNSSNQLEVEVKNSALTVDLGSNNDVTVTGTVGHDITGITSGTNVAIDNSTAENLSAVGACKRMDIQADPANTGYIWIGGSNVTASRGVRLGPGDFYSIDCDNTADVYAIATVADENAFCNVFT